MYIPTVALSGFACNCDVIKGCLTVVGVSFLGYKCVQLQNIALLVASGGRNEQKPGFLLNVPFDKVRLYVMLN